MMPTKSLLAAGLLSTGMLFSAASEAALESRGLNMIYDSTLNITWLDMSQSVSNWSEAVAWADNLTHAGYSDWRLASAAPVNGAAFQYDESADGSTDWGYNITSTQSELAHLYYSSLGNTGAYASNGDFIDGSLSNTGPFSSLQLGTYWFGTEYAPDAANFAWSFLTDFGLQTDSLKSNGGFAIAVRNGDVAPIPVPAAAWLFGSGLLGLVGMRRNKASV
ncbi:MAG: hypothetical protein CTY19_00380 [Methylomonas sp.]|nr:MAG: hypothetical protein CTY19_00380 [Methylomonas sp.]